VSHSSRRPLVLAVLFGGSSDEHEVSLRSARAVLEHLDRDRYDVRPAGITREGRWLSAQGSERLLQGLDPGEPGGAPRLPVGTECVFPVLHGPGGEDGTVQGWLQLLGMPFVGSDCAGAAASMDKSFAKRVLRDAGLPVVPWTDVTREEWEAAPEGLVRRLLRERGLPCFVKPARLGSSIGITRAETEDELRAGLRRAFVHGRHALVEKAVGEARELEIAILDGDDPVVSAPGEIVTANGWYDYAAKYESDDVELHVPAPDLPPRLADHFREQALHAFRLLRMDGMARVDFLMDRKSGRAWVNEVNAIPGFTSISMFPRLLEHQGLSLGEVLDRLVALALQRAHGRRAPRLPLETTEVEEEFGGAATASGR